MKLFLLFLFELISNGAAYKPVVLLHGILSGPEKMIALVEEIEKAHPKTKIYNFDKYDGWSSLENTWRQVIEFRNFLEVIGTKHPDGINVVGYSQGGLIARAAIQTLPFHKIYTFISLSAPQAGQFGANFLHLVFPDLAANTAYELFYSKIGQHISIANYWNDPLEQDLYHKFSKFLPLINNEIQTYNSSQFKNTLLRLNKMILIGGPNDGVITPWESSHFGYFNTTLNVIPLHKRPIYIEDAIGLKSLENNGKLIVVIKPFVHHLTWHTNRRVIQEKNSESELEIQRKNLDNFWTLLQRLMTP
ncbi:lysosomal thioesterase PPT2 homolog isoform X2 [Bactrocera oleae]|uniref:lysosomal thioesterase PPT2 homolog isoform X2 n=1 Tax=Bactrocera oleae TaxID=104688 RepID=UPI00387E67DD